MSAVLVACLGGFALLCLGALVVTSWVEQALYARYNRLAAERQERNEWRHALQEADQHRVWYGSPAAPYTPGQFTHMAVW